MLQPVLGTKDDTVVNTELDMIRLILEPKFTFYLVHIQLRAFQIKMGLGGLEVIVHECGCEPQSCHIFDVLDSSFATPKSPQKLEQQ